MYFVFSGTRAVVDLVDRADYDPTNRVTYEIFLIFPVAVLDTVFYVWVCTSLSGLSVSEAVFSYGGATLVGGIVSFTVVCLMWVGGLL